jgi:acetyl-CoA C-acetyltransferase
MEEVVIVSAVRTAVGRLGGSLRMLSPRISGRCVIKEALSRARVEPEEVDEVILGQTQTER